MRQVHSLLKIINKKNLTKIYTDMVSYGKFDPAKMPSLDEFLGVASGDGKQSFDAKTDAELERHALQKLEEAKAKHGRQ